MECFFAKLQRPLKFEMEYTSYRAEFIVEEERMMSPIFEKVDKI